MCTQQPRTTRALFASLSLKPKYGPGGEQEQRVQNKKKKNRGSQREYSEGGSGCLEVPGMLLRPDVSEQNRSCHLILGGLRVGELPFSNQLTVAVGQKHWISL